MAPRDWRNPEPSGRYNLVVLGAGGGGAECRRVRVRVEGEPKVDFPAVMERRRKLRTGIGPNDSAELFRNLGIDVFFGEAKFRDGETVLVDGKELKFSNVVIATGGRAIILPIPGLVESGALTNETLFSLTELSERLAIIGAGPIGCEMAQAFARFGGKVTLFEAECRILPREDTEASDIALSGVIHPYPTTAEAIQRIGDAYKAPA